MFRVAVLHADESIPNQSHQPCTDDASLVRFPCTLSALRGFRDCF